MVDLAAYSLLVGLAAFRVWRLVALDQVTDRLRAPLWARQADGLLTWLTCPWCAGWWTAAGVVAATGWWVPWPGPWWVWAPVAVFAAAAVLAVCAMVTGDGP